MTDGDDAQRPRKEKGEDRAQDRGKARGEDRAQDDAGDRRHEHRAPIELKVEYKRLNTFFYDYTKNISKGGTFIKTERPLDAGTVFLFRIQVPAAGAAIELRGEVRWVVRRGEPPPPPIPEGHEPGMGIRFMYQSEDERQRFERSVEKMMVGSLGQLIYSRLLGADRDDGTK
jgi:type IV pilus assembly protein PilZ